MLFGQQREMGHILFLGLVSTESAISVVRYLVEVLEELARRVGQVLVIVEIVLQGNIHLQIHVLDECCLCNN